MSAAYTPASSRRPRLNYTLWGTQGLLALIFVAAGAMKLVMPLADLADQSGLPGPFMKFIGVAEVLGGLGMILPGLLRIRSSLTPLAAAGLVIIMIGATVDTLAIDGAALAVMPIVIGMLAGFVAYGRSRLAPIRARGDSETGAGDRAEGLVVASV